ncbi:putative transcription factor NAM family [Helianthus annuus]|uniref:Putative NAC domain containing protein 61 n=1 Tax=Helianthus annuus TaxID=4232 RepID=A0A251VPN0_HELAN|nr:NAC domain-containing protein 90 [Helianthus annuus]KAF5821422.1 putative transcription factor NAM family [Helianthus annuus]
MTPGFRFYPTEEELITFYLKHKIQGANVTRDILRDIDRVIPQLHVYDFYPWDLPQHAGEVCRGDPEQWFFFIPRQEKEARGGRPSRRTSSGYWKATGSPSVVYSSSNRIIGIKRSMVFYNGRAPTGKKTKWKMNEYKAFQQEYSSNTNTTPKLMQEVSLCRVYIKSTCLRAFDRRPLADHQTLESNDRHATTSTHLTGQPTTQMIASPFDHSHTSFEAIEDQPLWEWEENHNWL